MIPGVTSFDELNKLVGRQKSEPFDTYFGDMDLTEEEEEERIELAEKFEREMMPIMALLFLMQLYGTYDWDDIEQRLYDAYGTAIADYMTVDARMADYMRTFAGEIVRSTQEHLTDPYFFSADRAAFIAENETNTTLEYRDFDKAIREGKTRKQWRDMRDNRVRQTHREVGGTVLPIWEPFEVGGYLMMYPKDESLGAGPEEIISCRCHCLYMR